MPKPIPEDVIYVLQKPTFRKVNDRPEKYQEAAVVDARNTTCLRTAVRWASNDPNKPPTQLCFPNSDIPSVRFVRYQHGRHGVATWHVLVHGRFLVELSDKAVADLLTDGVKVGAEFVGPFRWGTAGSGLKLLRVGSPEWETVAGKSGRRAMAKIRKSDLEIGRIYIHENLTRWLFLGLVDSTSYRRNYSTGQRPYTAKPESGELWLSCGYTVGEHSSVESTIAATGLHAINIQNGIRVVESAELLTVGPDGPLPTIRAMASSAVRDCIRMREERNRVTAAQPVNPWNRQQRYETPDLHYAADMGFWLLLRPIGEKAPAVPELEGIEGIT